MAWHEAQSLLVLLKQVDNLAPKRSKIDDGEVGDLAHAARVSDHNPDSDGVVKALDITHDPRHGFDSYVFAEQLRTHEDNRIKYVISNRKIFYGLDQDHHSWIWMPYHGSNPHDEHIHISVRKAKLYYDNTAPWIFGALPLPDEAVKEKVDLPRLRRGDHGESVSILQAMLNLHGGSVKVDGDFGAKTELAVRAFQDKEGLIPDGRVGGYTWRKLQD